MEEKIKLIQRLADMGMLAFDEEETSRMAKELDEILSFVDCIKEADVKGVQPERKVVNFEDLREDIAEESLSKEDLFKNAFHTESGCFVAPKVVE
jgi:aspartyl-tRNA(Asn)/glutamyl-tRNA(Gln) amidotransferase subunit C